MPVNNLLTLHEAIVAGLERAASKNLTKPSDVAFSIAVAIDEAGLKVIRAAKMDPTKTFTKSR